MNESNSLLSSQWRSSLREKILAVSEQNFTEVALELFQYQAEYNPVYRSYLNHLDRNSPGQLTEIPFLPIQFFKHHSMETGYPPGDATIFESSGTTGQVSSKHALFDSSLYHQLSTHLFESHYGALENLHVLALLPSYLERNNSSLVYMVDEFVRKSGSRYSGFYLHNVSEMEQQLKRIAGLKDGKRILIIGVTFALLDWVEAAGSLQWVGEIPDLIVMETGGMKGRRKELLREEVHEVLCAGLGVDAIHSEYGMTELLSQAYSFGEGLFEPSASLKILLREIDDPFAVYAQSHRSFRGGVNVIDLGNLDSCAFIETMDLGKFGEREGSFYIIGRFDNSDIRGCNLMVL